MPTHPALHPHLVGSRRRAFENLVKTLVAARKSASPPLTQEELARLLHKRHQSQVAKLEAMEHEIRLDDLVFWARAVGKDPAELLRAFENDLLPRAGQQKV